MKLLVLVANSRKYPSNISIPSIKRVYKNIDLDSDKYEFIIYEGDHESDSLIDNVLQLNVPGDFKNVGNKVLKTFSWVYENIEFDYLVRIVTSTYLDVNLLYKHLNELNKKSIYGGYKILYTDKTTNRDINFASGANLILSRDVLKILLDNKKSWDHNQYDDVNIGNILFEQQNFEITQFDMQIFKNYPFFKDINNESFQYRFRLDLYNIPRFLEVLVFEIIHFRVINKKNTSFTYKITNLILDTLMKPIFFIFQKINPNIYIYKFKKFKYRTGVKIRKILANSKNK